VVSVRELEVLSVEMESLTVNGKCRYLMFWDGTSGGILWDVSVECEGDGGIECECGDS
jgi:hypothetical protein